MSQQKWSKAQKDRALNTRISLVVPSQLVHDHCAIISDNDEIPDNDIDALIWLHRRKEALVDLVWNKSVFAADFQPIRILDLGCGSGGTLARVLSIAEHSNKLELVGVTESEEQISTAEQVLPEVTWIAGNMLTLRHIPLNWFHLIIAIESTEYLGKEGLVKFMTRAHNLLAPNGILAVVAHSWTETPPDSVIRNRLNQHFEMKIASLQDYKKSASSGKLETLDTISLTQSATLYWKECFGREIFRTSNHGWVEESMYATLVNNQAAYQLFIWQRKT